MTLFSECSMGHSTRYRSRRTSLLLATTLALGCAGAGAVTAPTPPTPPAVPVTSATIDATPAIVFSPAEVHLVQGGTVTFAFGTVGHNVFFDNDPAGAPENIGGVNSNTNVSRVFTTAGTYTFNCHIHPGMRGTVIVAAPDTA